MINSMDFSNKKVNCCVCYEEENFLGCINCYTCKDGILCIDCVESITDRDFILKCPCCRSDINHYNVNTIMSMFLDDLTHKPITKSLYKRLYNNYRLTDTYELYQCCY